MRASNTSHTRLHFLFPDPGRASGKARGEGRKVKQGLSFFQPPRAEVPLTSSPMQVACQGQSLVGAFQPEARTGKVKGRRFLPGQESRGLARGNSRVLATEFVWPVRGGRPGGLVRRPPTTRRGPTWRTRGQRARPVAGGIGALSAPDGPVSPSDPANQRSSHPRTRRAAGPPRRPTRCVPRRVRTEIAAEHRDASHRRGQGVRPQPRTISDAAIDAVAKSIEAFGFKIPILIDADGVIIAGHTRLRARGSSG